ncbi:MAG: DNA anti-recombination protein RmuC [Natronomonas sp.]|jgi:DNA anti-recombination protein RmuC
MALGGTAKKLQKVIDAAEQLYSKMNEVIERVGRVEDDLETTSAQVDHIERELAEQRTVIEALAERQGVDVEATLAAADRPSADEDDTSEGDAETGTTAE